ncbi:Cna B-type domain-containing protein [Tissierella pigra]|uniref:Cna B-type domain-containing protein n=2 Tax=Tissierella pigra TaxID=2607614 RepID=A0A6N7XZN4_9FIRM|nr:Cna B-type domain-containing protein [Tissierella pigra]MSU02054.1 Cna B-type domain-containing protein [Tissierella pigra]
MMVIRGDDTGIIEDEDTDGSEVIDGTKEDDEVEGTIDDSTDKTEEPIPEVTGRIGKPLVLLAYTGDMEGLDLDDGNDESYTFSGSFVVWEGKLDSDPKKLNAEDIGIKNLVFGSTKDKDLVAKETAGGYLLELGVNELEDDFYISFDFSLDGNHSINPGDYYEFSVPTAFALVATTEDIVYEGETIATYTINESGKITITFADAIRNEDGDGQPVDDGEFKASWALGDIVKSGQLNQEYKFDVNGEKKLNIIIKNNNTETIKKHDGKHPNNGATVQWEVDVNKAMADIGGWTLSDSMQEYIVPNSIQVYELIPRVQNGNVEFSRAAIPTTDGFELTGDTFPITFKTENNKAYKIYYETKVTDDQREAVFNDNSTISNTVTLSKDGEQEKTDTKIAELKFDKPITKTATDYDSRSGEIDWTVTVNADGRDISEGVTVTDTLTLVNPDSKDNNYMEFVKNGDTVVVTISPEEKSGTKKVSLTGDKTSGYKLVVEFKPTEANKTATHTITYSTKDDVVDQEYRVKNEATISHGSNTKEYKSNVEEKTVKDDMISKGGQSEDSINYEDKTIQWNFTFNNSEYDDITNVKITDTFEIGKYLKMYKNDFIDSNKSKIDTNSDGTATSNGFKLELNEPKTDEDGKEYTLTGFTLTLVDGGVINAPVTFTYKTTFDPTEPYENDNITNNISVDWTKGITKYLNSTYHTSYFNDFTKNNGAKVGVYNPINKTIEWYVDINYNKHKLANAKVIDEFGAKQTMNDIENTVEVYLLSMEGSADPKEVKKVNNYTVKPLSSETSKTSDFTGFELTFNNEINQPYRIKYVTKYKEQFIGELDGDGVKAGNKATLYNIEHGEDKKISELPKEIDVTNAGEYLKKDGRDISNKDYLEWKLKVNESQSHIKTGSTIQDTLNDGQILVENFDGLTLNGITTLRDTFQIEKRVYTRTHGTDDFKSSLHPLTKTEVDDLFNIEVSVDKKSFTITLLQDIDHEYEISYVTDISDSVADSLSNSYTYNFIGTGTKTDTVTETQAVTYEFSGGSAALRKYNLKLVKKDGVTPLQNVKFGLYNKTGLTLIKEITSDASGVLDFGSIKWGEYRLRETEPLLGYTNYFKIGSTGEFISEYILKTTGTAPDITLDIFNEKSAKIIIDKYNKDSNIKLKGAKFEIKKGDTIVDTIITDANGKASSIDLPPGEYTLIEIQAPEDYAKVAPQVVTLVSGIDSEVSIPNELLHQSVELTKVDSTDNGIKLEGAIFTIHSAVDNKPVLKNTRDEELGVLKTDSQGEIVVNNLPLGNYYFKEVEASDYYILSGNDKIDFEIKENQTDTTKVTVKNTRGKGEIIITKVDTEDDTIFLEGAEFKLTKPNDPNFVRTGKANSEGKLTFENLPYDTYILEEIKAPEGYTLVKEPIEIVLDGEINDVEIRETIKNIKKISVKGTKKWVDGPVEKPTIWFKLYRNINNNDPEAVEGAEIKKLEGTLSIEWHDLDKVDKDGNEYIYSIKEVNEAGEDFTPGNYEKAGNGLEITNYYVSPTNATAKAVKEWVNGPENRPTIWFKLYRHIEGGAKEEVPAVEAPIKELKSGTTEVVWNTLTKTDSAGNEYIFSVEEVDAEGNQLILPNYDKQEDGLTVINTYVIPKTEFTATKKWIGGSNTKPTIELQLYRDGEKLGVPVKLENGETEYTWNDLDKTDIDGKEYKYTVDEVNVPSRYRKSIDGATITNTYYSPTRPSPDPGPGPDRPTRPTDPEKPTTPVDPTKPTEPTEPVEPTDPVEITEVPKPEEPEIPIVITPPKGGTIEFDEDGNWKYTPNPGFTGKDSFILKHPDGTEELIEIDVEAPRSGLDEDGNPVEEAPKLPKTGEINSVLISLVGLFFILVGIILRRRTA